MTNLLATISAVGSLLFAMLVTMVGLFTRAMVKWTRLETIVAGLQKQMIDSIDDSAKARQVLYDVIREDRDRADKRITWLEHGGKPR